MDFTLNINMDNADFENMPHMILAEILEKIANKIERGANIGKIMDVNGNTVGKFEITIKWR